MQLIELYTKLDDFINSEVVYHRKSTQSIFSNLTWDNAQAVFDEELGILFINKRQVHKVLTDEELELLEETEIIGEDTRVSIAGKRSTCVVIYFEQLESKVRKNATNKTREQVLAKQLGDAKKEISILSKALVENEEASDIFKAVRDKILSSPPDEISKTLNPGLFVNQGGVNAGVPTLFLSDLHWAEVVFPEQVEHLNEYDLDIAINRLERVFSKSVDLLFNHMSGQTYDGIFVPLGGDMMSGNIHEELCRTNDIPIADAVFSLATELAKGIRMFATMFNWVKVPCVVGNHGRMDKKPTMKNKVKDNFDYMVYKFLQALLSDLDNVEVMVSDAADIRYDIYNTRYLLTHGDQVQGGSGIGGIWPSMMKTAQRKMKRHQANGGTGFDIMICGHFHHLGMCDGVIVNGSLKGYDEYAYMGNFDFERAQQALWITHEHHGITAFYPIFGD